MKFVLEIELGNDAMQTANDIARALHNAAGTIGSEGLVFGDGQDEIPFDYIPKPQTVVIRDDNGNAVGSWEIRA